MDGGELVATGSSSCIFTPNFHVKTGKIKIIEYLK